MTFNQAEKKIANLTEHDLDIYGVLLSKLMSSVKDKTTAEAIELSYQALCLYTKGGK